jgi:ribulose kinase
MSSFIVSFLFTVTCLTISISASTSSTTQSSPSSTVPSKLVIGVDGGTESIRACCFDATNGNIVGKSCAVPYQTHHPQGGWAEQSPDDWWSNNDEIESVVSGKEVNDGEAEADEVAGEVQNVQDEPDAKSRVCAICIDTTCCSVVALDENYNPLRPSLLWMDARSAPQTKDILKKCKGDPALRVNCNGKGPLSAEWMTPKSLWIKQNEPEVWEKAKTICEYQDFINYKLTGVMCASSCNAAARWHWDGEKCLKPSTTKHPFPGRPMSLYKKLGMPELAEKLPQNCLAMGSLVGKLHKDAAEHLSLNEGTPVAQGGPDAFVGMVGLGCIHPQQLCLITGSSHLHCVVTAKPTTATGSWG